MSPRSLSAFFLLCVFTAMLSAGCDWASPEAKKARHQERAANYFEKGQYQEAAIEYQNVTQLDPKDADAHYRLAVIRLKLGGLPNLQAAFADLTRSLQLDKTNRDAQLKLGELYLLGNAPAKAREQAEIVLVSAPQDPEGLILKGRALVNEKRYEEGITELRKAIELDAKNMQVYIELARAHFAAKDPAAAEAVLNQALTINPRSIEIMLALGDVRATIGKPDQAEIIYKKALEIDPQNENIYLRLTDLYQRQNKVVDAEAMLQKWASSKPQDETPLIVLGDFFTGIGQTEKALGSYQRAMEVKPGSPIVRDKLIGHYLDTGKTNEAEAKVKQILEKNNKDLMGRFFDARIQLAKHKPEETISILQGVVKDEPQFAGAHHFLGVAFLQKNEKGQARAAFSQALKINPRLTESRTALAQIHLSEGSTDLAIEESQAAIQLNPRNIQAAIISGDAYLRKGDIAKSKQVFEALAKALPNESLPLYRLGLVARAEKNDTKALAYFEEALNKKPGAIEPLSQLAHMKISQDKLPEARERVIRQLEASPNNAMFYNLLGQISLKAKDVGQAETAFKKAIEIDNFLFSAYLSLGQIYYQAGKTDEAVKEYEAVLAKNPNMVPAYMLLGIIHEKRKEYDRAQANYETALRLAPRFALAANNLAWLMAERGGNLDVALAHAQTAREVNHEDPRVADTLGWIYYKKNAYLLAMNLLKEAVEKLPNVPEVQYHYGMALFKTGDAGGAKKSLQTALKLNQSFPGSEEAKKTLAGL